MKDDVNHNQYSFDFSQLNNNQFEIVNDGVMGGRSTSELIVEKEAINFAGTLSLENNGGFASVRMNWPFDMKRIKESPEPETAVLKFRGDGQSYQFRLSTDRGFDGASYSYAFNALKDEVQIITITVNEFIATYRGRTITDMPPLRFSDVQQMGLLISDKQVGDFNIDLIELRIK